MEDNTQHILVERSVDLTGIGFAALAMWEQDTRLGKLTLDECPCHDINLFTLLCNLHRDRSVAVCPKEVNEVVCSIFQSLCHIALSQITYTYSKIMYNRGQRYSKILRTKRVLHINLLYISLMWEKSTSVKEF